MPQNPFDLLRRPYVPPAQQPTQIQLDNNDLRAKAIQEQDPTWKKVGRGLFDALTSAVGGDPFAEDADKASMGSKIGMMAAAVPAMPKRLPIIAPEAYDHVKAGGLKLYSRLTDTFAKAPKQMNPDKIRSLAKQGASAEEVQLRKLEEFLSGRQPMEKVAREDVMNHLAANPLELDVVRKSASPVKLHPAASAEQDLAVFEHELDTEYGGLWSLENITPEQRARHQELTRQVDAGRSYGNPAEWDDGAADQPRYDWLQTPGPKENYGETLINLPNKAGHPPVKVTEFNNPLVTEFMRDTPNPEGDYTDDMLEAWYAKKYGQSPVFTSTHWDEPNNLVWTRHNERFLESDPLSATRADIEAYAKLKGLNPATVDPNEVTEHLGSFGLDENPRSKGWFTEEIQSDWGQQGRDYGFKGDPVDLVTTKTGSDNNHDAWMSYPAGTEQFAEGGYSFGYGPDAKAAEESAMRVVDANRPPQMPFKDTYHELGLKADVLDWADRDDMDWYGIADAYTNASMEGHDTLKAGTQIGYDEKHPSALAKMLNPLGAPVRHTAAPTGRIKEVPESFQFDDYSVGAYPHDSKSIPVGARRVVDFTTNPQQGTHVMDIRPGYHTIDAMEDLGRYRGKPAEAIAEDFPKEPRGAMWATGTAAGMTSEQVQSLKALIRERGFPAMAALLALQQQFASQDEEQ